MERNRSSDPPPPRLYGGGPCLWDKHTFKGQYTQPYCSSTCSTVVWLCVMNSNLSDPHHELSGGQTVELTADTVPQGHTVGGWLVPCAGVYDRRLNLPPTVQNMQWGYLVDLNWSYWWVWGWMGVCFTPPTAPPHPPLPGLPRWTLMN